MNYLDNDDWLEKKEIPSSEKMFQPIMLALKELGGEGSVEQIDSKAIELMGLPERLSAIPHRNSSSRTEVSYRLAWARSCLKKYGWIVNVSRGIWRISPSFDSTIQDIDGKAITKKIREGNLINGVPISSLESAAVFEKFAYSVISDYVKGQGKPKEHSNQKKNCGYDLFLPEGYDNINMPTYVVFKYSVANKNAYYKLIENILMQFKGIEPEACILIIFGAVYTIKKVLQNRYLQSIVPIL